MGGDGLPNTRVPTIRNQTLIGAGLFVFAIWGAWQAGNEVASDNLRVLELVALGFVACAIAVTILRNWRTGFYIFLVWMLFEDLWSGSTWETILSFSLARTSFCFSSTLPFSGTCVSAGPGVSAPPSCFFGSFFWFGLLQVFNRTRRVFCMAFSGLKTYFFLYSAMFVAYGLIRTDQDLLKFLVANVVFGRRDWRAGNRPGNSRKLVPESGDARARASRSWEISPR